MAYSPPDIQIQKSPLQRIDTHKNNEIGLSVDTILLSSSNINEGITFLREGTDEVTVHSLNELECDVSYYTLNQNRVIRPSTSLEVNLISSDGECIQIPIPKSPSPPRVRRDSNAKPKLAAIQQIDVVQESLTIPNTTTTTTRRYSFDQADDISALEQFQKLPKSSSGHLTLNGVILPFREEEADEADFYSELLAEYEDRLQQVKLEKSKQMEVKLSIVMRKYKEHYSTSIAEPLLNRVDYNDSTSIDNNSEFIVGLKKKITPAYSKWQRDNLYKDMLTNLNDKASLYSNLQRELNIHIKNLLDLFESKMKYLKELNKNAANSVLFIKPNNNILSKSAVVSNTVVESTPKKNKTLEDELDELLDSATPDAKKNRKSQRNNRNSVVYDSLVHKNIISITEIPDECFTIE